MSSKIRVLPEPLCNKIAAGEVVERPSSVVKELVENSIDAGADQIFIDLESGGRKLIQVIDNGAGMDPQDAFLSLERHATSKIATDEDLFALHTLGFRGEALASIASVSRFRLRTSASDDGLGCEIYAEGGQVKNTAEVGLPRGTRIEVRNLFFNMPARKKFLRKEQTELGHVADVVTKQALAHPEIHFRLVHGARTLLDLRREAALPERVAALLGKNVLQGLLPIEQEYDDLKIYGLISQPSLSRSSGSHIYTFVNGRYIRDRVVQHAVMDGYRQLLMKGRYPVAVLFLQLDPAQVDVNVHPTKHEVRFRQQSLVHDALSAAIRDTLRPTRWIETPAGDGDRDGAAVHESPSGLREMQSATPQVAPDRSLPQVQDQQASYRSEPPPAAPVYSPPVPEPDSPPAPASFGIVPGEQLPLTAPMAEEEPFFTRLQLLGQYHQSYLLCQDGDDLVLIDQHAAHERIGFEHLKASFFGDGIAQQQLLFPEMLELDFRSAAALEEHGSDLLRLGFDLEPFGGKSFALKAVPALLAAEQAGRLVVDVALELERIGYSGQLQDKLDEVLILMACHGVVRANQALSRAESLALLRELDGVDFKAHCPHGRPVMQRLTLFEIEKMFRRQ